MISDEELIKHKWKYIQIDDVWSKLCASFSNADRVFDHFTIRYADCLAATVSSSSIEDLENDVKSGAKIIFSIPFLVKKSTQGALKALRR